MMFEIVNSKLTAFVMGIWITYCLGVGSYDGATVLLLFYGLMLWSYKKSTGAHNTDAK